jgi:hypothetical protein
MSEQPSQRINAALRMHGLPERSRGKFDFGQSEPWSFGDESADPPRRRPLIPLRIVAVEQAQLQRVGQADLVEITRGSLSDPRVPRR